MKSKGCDRMEQKVEEYLDIFHQMNQQLKWTDDRTLMMAASVYAVHGAGFDVDRYVNLCEHIKEESGFFSHLKSNVRFSVAAVLDVKFEDPEAAFVRFSEAYDKLIDVGFKRSPFTYLAALVLLQTDQVDAERARLVYDSMKSEHPFITTNDDYPLAVLLAERDGDIDTLMDEIEHIYRTLNSHGFWKGNNLQFLSHILSLDETHRPEERINQTLLVYDELKRIGMKPKGMHYPEVGMLALMKQPQQEVPHIQTVKDSLDREKHLKWHKDVNYKLAVQLVLSEELAMMETGLFTSMEVVMQAQQVALMAGVAGAAAASGGE
ncbi:DUF4003 domain-containing protein [Halobacillus fulvus]|nr:DUF4003 domain-containing protein [Halobacillus fulvus]